MRHHSDSDPRDALNDYLDSLAGAPPPDSHSGDVDSDLRDGVDRFLDLAERAGMAPADTRRPAMNATLPASTTFIPSEKETRRSHPLPPTRLLHLASTGFLIVLVIALSFAAFGPNGIGNGRSGDSGTGDGPSLNGAVPIATVPDDAETTTLPYPGPAECTVEPMTRDELIAHIQEANVATEPEYERYEQAIEPSDEDAQAIMQAFDEWRACGLDTPETGPAYELQFQTPWYSANALGIFINYQEGRIERPVSEQEIVEYVDALLQPEVAATPSAFGTPPHPLHEEVPDFLPIPEGATPVVYEGGRAFPTIFAEDIVITGPNTATARAHFVHEDTREVMPSTPLTYGFVKVDGQWLINDYREGIGG